MVHALANVRSGAPAVICYDGSEAAIRAVEYTAELFPGARALVVYIWRPIIEELVSAASVPGPTPPVSDPTDTNERQRRVADETAREGARLAAEAGLQAEPLARALVANGSAWKAVERLADERDAWLIVCGNRRTGVVSALPPNLAGELVSYASRPVLVVPGAKAAAERRRKAREKKA